MLLLVTLEIWTELFTPDKNAVIAFLIGLAGGLLGTYLRNQLAPSKKSRREGLKLYLGWAAFGALTALTINLFPFFSFSVGVGAPVAYKAMEEIIPGIIDIAAKLKTKKE